MHIGQWIPLTGRTDITQLTARGKIKASITPVMIGELRALDQKIGDAVESVYYLAIGKRK